MQKEAVNNAQQLTGGKSRLAVIVVVHLIIAATFFAVTFIWGSFA